MISMETQVVETRTAPTPVRAFLSFATADKPSVEAFKSRLGRQYPRVELLDHAVNDSYEEDWKQACATKIDRSELLICLIGPATHRSQAVAWEIHRGLSLGKRIVAVKLSTDWVQVPEVLARHAIQPRESIADIDFASATTPAPKRGANDLFE
ncbi:MAG: TIR domain-containing protein [Gammaproteobacteria bacterium]|nr:TIR domain-containing protein [Gammaproteobacteria bacterium]